MQKATLTALAWRQSFILWGFIYALVLAIAYFFNDGVGVLYAWATLTTIHTIRAYSKLAKVMNRLESRAFTSRPDGQGVWAALDTLVYKKNQAYRQRISRLALMLRGYRSAASALPEGAMVISRQNGYILWSNKTAKRMLGLHPGDDETNLFALFNTYEQQLKDWFQQHNADLPLLNIPAAQHSETTLDLFLLPYTTDRSLIVLRDSTKVRRLEQMRSDFVANVSHELRTPLTVIHGYLELIEQQDNPELQNIIIEMQKQSSRMNHLVEDLLNLSRLESEQHLPDETINLPSLLNTMKQEAIALSQGRHSITTHNDFQGSLLGSNKDIHSAFSNLVSNAIRYTQTGGSVSIGTASNTLGGVDFYVKDSGFGIPADHISRLTERFYRVSASRSRESGGTGLGLSICKHVLNLHQAELLIESTPGKGSTFTCRFPKKRIV